MYFSPRYENWYDFENSWLSFIAVFGVFGVALCFIFIKNYVFNHANRYLVLFTIPWLSYSVVFPIFQEQCAVFISWFILTASLNFDKWAYLNNIQIENADPAADDAS